MVHDNTADQKLAELIESGDREELARALVEPVLGILMRRHADEEDATEALPAAVKSLLSSRKRFKDGISVRAWILSVIATKMEADKPRSDFSEAIPEGETAEELAEKEGLIDEVEVLLSLLPEDQRDAIELLGVEGLTPKEAAAIRKEPSAVVEQKAEIALAAMAEHVQTVMKK